MKKIYQLNQGFSQMKTACWYTSLLLFLSILFFNVKAQNPNLPVKATLSQTLLSGKTFSNATAVDTVTKVQSIPGTYTLEVNAKINSATGRGLDIESRNSVLNGFRISLDASNLKLTNPLTAPQILTASGSGQNHLIMVAVRNDSAHIYQNGIYLLSQPLAGIKDIANGVETDLVTGSNSGANLSANWAGLPGNNAGTPGAYGWALDGSTTNSIFNVANGGSGVRYLDITAATASTGAHTNPDGTNFIGRLMYMRWDADNIVNSVYSFPVTLEANTNYDFSWLFAYVNNANASSRYMTVGIGKTRASTDRYATKTFYTNGTRAFKKENFAFTSQEAGTYYLTFTGLRALFSVSDLSVKKFFVDPRFIFGKNYPTGAVDMEIISATYEDGAYAPAASIAQPRQTVTLSGTSVQIPTSFNTDFVVPGKTDVHFTGEYTPYANSSIALNTNDSWLFFDNVKPAKVISDWLSTVTVNGAPAANNTNVRIAVYKNGTVVIPNGNLTNASALQVFDQPAFAGTAQTYPINAIQNNLGAFNNNIRSFKLKRGYMVTFANNADGSGYSRVFVANDADLEIAAMPDGLDATASFVRVLKWNWPSKKGKAGWDPDKVGATWYYDWNIGGNASASNYEYQSIRQTQYWPGFGDIINKGVNHILGFNEPDRPDQANMTVDQCVAAWPSLMQTGLRIGSPAPANPESSYITDFLRKTDSLNYRVDYVAIHCYWGGATPSQWYSRLKAIYDRVKRPLWITEWNNGANWTTESWPTDVPSQLQKQLADLKGILQVLDTASFVERYAEYDWVENKRALVLADTLTPAGKYYYANKSDFAYNPAKAFVHNWKLIAPRISSNINSNDYYKVTLNWPELNGETGSKYILERKIDGRDADFVTAQEFNNYNIGNAMSFVDSVYTKATYRIKAFAKDGTTFVYSFTVDVLRDAAPVAPTSLTGTVISSSRIQLNWNAGTNVRSYNLKRSLSASGPWDTIALRTSNTAYLDSNLTPNTTYYYLVTTLNSAGESAASTVLQKSTPDLTTPTAVVNPHIASGDAKVTLTWDLQYDSKYKIVRSASVAGTYDTIADVSGLRYEDLNKVNGTNYYYKIVAYNEVGTGPATAMLTAKPMLGQHLHIGFNEATGAALYDDWGAYNGAMYNAATWVAGKDSTTGAINLVKASASYVQLADGVVSTLNDFTIATWFKMPASQGVNTRVFDFATSTANFMMLSPRYNANGVNGLRYKLTCPAGTYQPTIPYELPLDAWVHVVISQKDSVFKLYVNGILQFTDNAAYVKPSDMGITNQNYIGKSVWATDPACDHTYDDFRIYNYAMSDQNVYNLFQGNPVILPITLTTFNGKATPQGNLLNWKVNTTSASINMELQRSIDSRNFTGIYSVIASRSTAQLPFSYVDAQAKGNINYYRLKMTDVDGKISYSPVVAIATVVKGIEIIGLYPNLVNTNAYLSISSSKDAVVKLVITDAFGRTVQSASKVVAAGSNLLNVDASALASGTYIISVYHENERTGNIRFIVSH